MKKAAILGVIFVLTCMSFIQAQNPNKNDNSSLEKKQIEDSLLFTFIYLESGDVYVGNIVSETDTALVFVEKNLGRISLHPKEVEKIETIFRNSFVQLTLIDNSKYTGNLLDVEGDNYVMENVHSGMARIPRIKVTRIVVIENKRLVTHNPNSTRYFFAPSAFPIEKNTGYYQNAYLLSNSVNFGLTRSFSLGGGVVIPFLFFITPKVGFEVRKNLYLGAGLIAATTLLPGAIISGGIPFGILTIGNRENNFTIAGGYGFMWNDSEYKHTNYPLTTVNGMVKISKRLHLVSENWIVPYNDEQYGYYDSNGFWVEGEGTKTRLNMFFSLGMRVLSGENSAIDFAPVYIYDGDDGIVIPYLDFVYKF